MPINKRRSPLCAVLWKWITHPACFNSRDASAGGTVIISSSKAESIWAKKTFLPHFQQQKDQIVRAYAGKGFYNTFIRTIQGLRQKSQCWYLSSFSNLTQLTLITKEVHEDNRIKDIFCQKGKNALAEQEKPMQSKELPSLPVVADNSNSCLGQRG